MMLAAALPPTPGDVVLGILAVLVGALVATTSTLIARRTHNWLHHLGTAGGLLIVAGVVGQRTPAPGATLGPWTAGIAVPGVGVHLDPVTTIGIILALLGLILTLLFERVPEAGVRSRPLVHRPMEDDDTV